MKEMLASGTAIVEADSTSETVELDTDDMPEYFMAAAYLLDPSSHKALCDFYTTSMYTKEIQDLKNSTVEDYDEELVLNLDDNSDTNFAVYSPDTAQADESSAQNNITDVGNGTFTINNADEQFRNLKEGDTFSYEYENGEVLLVKAASVSVEDSTVTVTEDKNADLTDFFDYFKIEAQSDGSNAVVDNSDLEDGVTYLGEVTKEDAVSSAGVEAVNGIEDSQTDDVEAAGDAVPGSFVYRKYEINQEFSSTSSLKGSFTFGVQMNFEYYLSLNHQYVSFISDWDNVVSMELSGKLQGSDEDSWKKALGHVEEPLAPGVNVGFTPYCVIEASTAIKWSGEMTYSLGLSYDSDTGFENACKSPQTSSKVTVEGKLFIGMEVKPFVSVIEEELFNINLKGQAGIEFKSSPAAKPSEEKEFFHGCRACLDGEMDAKIKATGGVEITEGRQYNRVLIEETPKISDFYYSSDYGEFGWGTCPHITYKVELEVKDDKGKTVPSAAVNVVNENGETQLSEITDADGKVSGYLVNGKYTLDIVNASGKKCKVSINDGDNTFSINNKAKKISVTATETDETTDTKQGKCGDNLTWEIDDGVLYIKGTGNMWDFEILTGKSNAPWYQYISEINSIDIEIGVTSIGNFAFGDCNKLKNVKIPNSVTRIGEDAFNDCKSLQSVIIPNSVTSMEGAFAWCRGLQSIEIPSSVTNINRAFSDCSSLQSVKIPNSVTSMDGTFEGCTSLQSIEIPSSVTSLDYAFRNCSSLQSVKIPNSVTSLFYTFAGCDGLQSIEIPNDVTSIEGAFMGCSSLQSVKIPSSVTRIGEDAFAGCSNLLSIELPERITSIGGSVFEGCRKLRSIDIPNNVTRIGGAAFKDCSSLQTITIPKNVAVIGDENVWYTFRVFEGCVNLRTIYFMGSRPECLWEFGNITVTAYYPQNDSSWDGVESEDDFDNITWVPYDPATFSAASAGEATDSAGILDNTTDGQFTDNTQLAETEETTTDFAENTEAEIVFSDDAEQSGVPTDAAADTDAETASDTDVEIITEMVPPVSYSGATDIQTVQSAAYSNLVPGSACVFAVFRDASADDLFASDNLLYIAQKTADSRGIVSFSYIPGENYADPETAVFCDYVEDLSSAEVTVADLTENGKSQIPAAVVILNGTQLEANIDYTLTGDTSVSAAGTYKLTVNGINGYTGSVSVTYTVAHAWSEWKTVKAATVFTPAKQTRTCSVCGQKETQNKGSKLKAKMTLNASSLKLQKGQSTSAFKISGLAKGDSVKSVSSGNKKLVRVTSYNSKGTVKLKAQNKTGTTKLTITLKSGLKKTVTVKVQSGKIRTTKVKAAKTTLTLKKGKTATLSAVITPITSQEKVTYTTSNKKVVTVSTKGVITAVKKGTAKITIKSGRKKAVVTIKVK